VAATYNIPTQYNGDTFEIIDFKFFEGSAEAGNELDLSTGGTVKMQVRRGSVTGEVVETLMIGSGFEWVNQSEGHFRTTEFIIDWGGGTYYYDLEIAYSSTLVKTYIKGSIVVEEDVTDTTTLEEFPIVT
jgi:hypothetical protein